MRFVKLLLPALLYLVFNTVYAQNLGPSVYSRLGIGDLADGTFSRNQGMGCAGVALSHNFQLNSLNPAALAALKYTNFEFGIGAKSNVQRTTDDSQRGTSASMRYISISLPLHKRFVTQFGVRPFSTINYNDNFSTAIGDKTYQTTLTGSGGLSEFFWGNAYNYHDWLMVGVNTGLILGQSTYDRTLLDLNQSIYTITTQRDAKIIRFSPGILITREIKGVNYRPLDYLKYDTLQKDSLGFKATAPVAKAKWFYGIGVTGSFYNTMTVNEDHFQSESRYDYSSGSYYGYKKDTLSSGTVSGFKLPSSVKVGLSLSKANKITIALDYTMSNWSNFSYNELNSTYRNQQITALGVEYIPDYNSITFYKRIAYRAGLNMNMLPYKVAGQNINQLQASIGAGFVLPKSGVTLNTTITYGQRGTTASNLVQENYWIFSMGIIANNKWFIRRKHE